MREPPGYVGTAGEEVAIEGERFNSNSTNVSFHRIEEDIAVIFDSE
jgi:hypothetical protein